MGEVGGVEGVPEGMHSGMERGAQHVWPPQQPPEVEERRVAKSPRVAASLAPPRSHWQAGRRRSVASRTFPLSAQAPALHPPARPAPLAPCAHAPYGARRMHTAASAGTSVRAGYHLKLKHPDLPTSLKNVLGKNIASGHQLHPQVPAPSGPCTWSVLSANKFSGLTRNMVVRQPRPTMALHFCNSALQSSSPLATWQS